MKISKFMCAAFAAAMVLAGCSKEETPEEVSKNYKSVDVVISNVKMATKVGGTDEALDNQKIQLNSLQFFFSDGNSFYQAYNENREPADAYLDGAELAALGEDLKLSFHFLPSSVKEVVVVGNLSEITTNQKTGLDRTLEIAHNQDVTNFPLYAEGALVQVGENTHQKDDNDHLSNVYKVDLNVVPRVARFEIKKIGCNFNGVTDQKIVVNSMAFTDFYDKADFRSGVVDINSFRAVNLVQKDIFDYFNFSMNASKWNNDYFDGADLKHPVVELTPDNNEVAVNIAYNFFPASAPVHLLDITQQTGSGDSATSDPAYIFTNTYKMNSGVEITTFEPGKIYRMNFVFGIDKLTQQEKCVDINVQVASWDVIEVTPGF